MTFPKELAASPTAPNVSAVLTEAARYVGDGLHAAITRAAYGSTDVDCYLGVVTPDDTLAWSMSLVACARHLDPVVLTDWSELSAGWDSVGRVIFSTYSVLEECDAVSTDAQRRQLLSEVAAVMREEERV